MDDKEAKGESGRDKDGSEGDKVEEGSSCGTEDGGEKTTRGRFKPVKCESSSEVSKESSFQRPGSGCPKNTSLKNSATNLSKRKSSCKTHSVGSVLQYQKRNLLRQQIGFKRPNCYGDVLKFLLRERGQVSFSFL